VRTAAFSDVLAILPSKAQIAAHVDIKERGEELHRAIVYYHHHRAVFRETVAVDRR
jgi:hypothetical protein